MFPFGRKFLLDTKKTENGEFGRERDTGKIPSGKTVVTKKYCINL